MKQEKMERLNKKKLFIMYHTVLTNRIAAAYFGCEIRCIHGKGEIVAISKSHLVFRNGSNDKGIEIPKCQLILNHLSEITDEDAVAVAKMLQDKSSEGLFDPEDFQDWMDEILTGNCATHADYVSGREFQKVLDYLRGKGYDMGYEDIPSLLESGIATTPE